MDFALESGIAANATHKIDHDGSGDYGIYEKRKFLWVVPYWHKLGWSASRAAAEAWLQANWKLPTYYHITRKNSA